MEMKGEEDFEGIDGIKIRKVMLLLSPPPFLQPVLTSSAGAEALQHGEDSQRAPGGRGRIQPWGVLRLYSSGDAGQLRGDVEASDGGGEQRCPQDKCGSG